MLKASYVDRACKQTVLSKQPPGALSLAQAWGSCLMQMSECSLALSAPSGQTVALPGYPGGQGYRMVCVQLMSMMLTSPFQIRQHQTHTR